jgi:hypothetical protein
MTWPTSSLAAEANRTARSAWSGRRRCFRRQLAFAAL